MTLNNFRKDLCWVLETQTDRFLLNNYEDETGQAHFHRWGKVDFSFKLKIKDGEEISDFIRKLETKTKKSGFTFRTFPTKLSAIKYLEQFYNPMES